LLDGDVFWGFDFFKVFDGVFGLSFRQQKCDEQHFNDSPSEPVMWGLGLKFSKVLAYCFVFASYAACMLFVSAQIYDVLFWFVNYFFSDSFFLFHSIH